MTYARNTTVSAMHIRNEIEETLERYGADGFTYATQGNLATVIFAVENRRIRSSWNCPIPRIFATPTTARPGSAVLVPSRRPCFWSSRPSWKRPPPASPPSRPSSRPRLSR